MLIHKLGNNLKTFSGLKPIVALRLPRQAQTKHPNLGR
jgi:hypothetical protein